MNQLVFLLPLFPLAGGLMAVFTPGLSASRLRIFIAFSGAFLFSVTVINIFPELFGGGKNPALYILAGFLFQLLIEQFTQGLEHGHLHQHHHHTFSVWPLFFSLSLHSFLEGYPLGSGMVAAGKSSYIIGIGLHELPAAFALLIFLKHNHLSRRARLVLLLLYSGMCMLGVATSRVLSAQITELETPALAFVAGIFLHISTTILFENSENHLYNRLKFVAIVLGMGLACALAFC